MSQESILQSLMNLGLTKAEAEVYFYLSKRGPKKASEITSALKMKRQQLYPVIRKLQGKSIITSTLDRPAEFSAVALEKILDLFAKAKFEEAKTIQLTKGKLLSDWQLISHPASKGRSSFFTVIKGTKIVYSKIQQMIQETQSQISVISYIAGLFHAEQFGILDLMENHLKKRDIQFRIVTEVPSSYLQAFKDLLKTINPEIEIRARNTELGSKLSPRMVTRDNEELLIFITPQSDNDKCLWTNCKSLVQTFTSFFDELWCNSTDIQKIYTDSKKNAITETIFCDAEAASKKYEELLNAAEEEIIVLTSTKGLRDLRKNLPLLKKCASKGISLKVMAPITSENLKVANQLSKQL